jgi:hypothetical protein
VDKAGGQKLPLSTFLSGEHELERLIGVIEALFQELAPRYGH